MRNDIIRSGKDVMPKHDGVILLSFKTKCKKSARKYTEMLMQNLGKVPKFKDRIWEKESTFSKDNRKGNVKFILHYSGDNIMECRDVSQVLDILQNQEKVKTIKLEKYEITDQPTRSSVSESSESKFIKKKEHQVVNVGSNKYRQNSVTMSKAISMQFECTGDGIQLFANILMSKLKRIKGFESRIYEEKVDITHFDAANVELVMSHYDKRDKMDDAVYKAVKLLKKEKRIKNLMVETIPYFIGA